MKPETALEKIESGDAAGRTLSVIGDLTLKGIPSTRFPDELSVDGNLIVQDTTRGDVTELPRKLQVRGTLVIDHCPALRSIHSGVDAHAALIINDCEALETLELTVFPETLRLSYCPKLRRLPEHVALTGAFEMQHSGLERMPRSFQADSMRIADCVELITLPEEISLPRPDVKPRKWLSHNLDVRRCPRLAKWPEHMTVHGAIVLDACPQLPPLPPHVNRTLSKHGNAFVRSLSVRDCPRFLPLPERMEVEQSIDLSGFHDLVSLDDARIGTEVHALTVANCSRLTTLPENFRCVAALALINLPSLVTLPRGLSAEHLSVSNCERFEALPPDLDVSRILEVTDCPALRQLPENLQVPWGLNLSRCVNLERLPPGLRVGFGTSIWDRYGLAIGSFGCLTGCALVLVMIFASARGLGKLYRAYPTEFLSVVGGIFALAVLCYFIARKTAPRFIASPAPTWVRRPPPETPQDPEEFDEENFDSAREDADDASRWPPVVQPAALEMLRLEGCRKIQELPATIQVRGAIDVADTAVRLLPPTLKKKKVSLAWRGVRINEKIAFRPEELTIDEVLNEQNVEVRRIMLERYPGGFERFITKANAKIVHSDTDRGGERKLLRIDLKDDEPLVCLQVHCPSTGALYVLRVPPNMETCHQAAAWVAGFDNPDEYKPLIET